jgi:hypothetical protein
MATTRGSLTVTLSATAPFALAAASIPSFSDAIMAFVGGNGVNYWTSGATPNASQGMPVPSGGYLKWNGDPTKVQMCAQSVVAPVLQIEFYQGQI